MSSISDCQHLLSFHGLQENLSLQVFATQDETNFYLTFYTKLLAVVIYPVLQSLICVLSTGFNLFHKWWVQELHLALTFVSWDMFCPSIHPSVLFQLSLSGLQRQVVGVGACPSYSGPRGQIHPGQTQPVCCRGNAESQTTINTNT